MAFELLTFLGLAFLLEGVALALFPGGLRRMMARFAALAPQQLRLIGLGAAAVAALGLVTLSRAGGDGGVGGMTFAFPATRAFIAALF
jgi:uncharacterized protein YjeT (DUF2065 family)